MLAVAVVAAGFVRVVAFDAATVDAGRGAKSTCNAICKQNAKTMGRKPHGQNTRKRKRNAVGQRAARGPRAPRPPRGRVRDFGLVLVSNLRRHGPAG